jgi:hypothetical protein
MHSEPIPVEKTERPQTFLSYKDTIEPTCLASLWLSNITT